MGVMPEWLMEPMKLVDNLPIKRVEVDSSKVHPTLLASMGYDKYHPAPEKLDGISMPHGLKTIVSLLF